MDAPVRNPGAAAAAAVRPQQGDSAGRPVGAQARPAAAPLRVGAANRAASAAQAARPMPQLLSEAGPRTRPLLIAQPPRQVRQQEQAQPTAPPKHTWTRHVRSYVERLSALQVICWQVAALTVLLTVRQPWPVLVAASVGAAMLLTLTTVRLGGRWLYALAWLAAAFLSRTRRRDLPESDKSDKSGKSGKTGKTGKTLSPPAMILPGAGVRTLETSQGSAMAISHQGGLSALLKPQALTPELLNTLPMPAALLPTVTDHTAGQHHTFGVQLVFHVGVRPDKPRRLWIAVRAARTIDTPADDELTLALRRVRPTLGRAAVTAEPLAEEQALAGLAHVTGGRNEVREDWRFWRTGAVSQATFQLTGSDRRAGPPSRQHAARWHPRRRRDRDAARAYRTPGDPRTGTAPRLAATTEAAADAMTARLAQSGVRLARLDRAHLSGVAASLPIGVFLS